MSGFLFTQDAVGLFAVSTAFGLGFSALIPGLRPDHPRALPDERGALARAGGAAAHRQRHGRPADGSRAISTTSTATTPRPSPPASPSTSPTSRSCSCCWCGRGPTLSRRAEPFGRCELSSPRCVCIGRHSGAKRVTLRAHREPGMQKPLAIALALLACPAIAHAQTFKSSAGDLKVETVAGGLSHPWALAFLPDGRMLVTERPGRMRIVDAGRQAVGAAAGVPKVAASGQGGLHDVVLDRDFAQNKTIYFCFAEPAQRRRAHRDGARRARRRQARRRQGDLPSGRPAVERQPFRLPHRAERRTTTCS